MPLADFTEHFLSTFPDLVGRRVLVALSGGPDSVALLNLLLDPEINLEIEAVHVHHGVRGAEADEDAAFCEALCHTLGVTLHTSRLDVTEPLEAGREGTWRRLRYDALLDLKRSTGAAAVATGHHRDDIAEGLLVQLLRGGGPRALAGIEEHTRSGVVRPLLPWSRGEILDWLTNRGIEWREDGSNSDLSFLRNRVRHQALPELEKMSPSIRSHLVHLAGALASSEAYLGQQVAQKSRWIDPWAPGGGIPIEAIRELAPPLRSRWLHAQARRVGLERVTRPQLALFEDLLDRGAPRSVTLCGRWCLRLAGGELWLEPPVGRPGYSIDLEPGQTHDLPMPGWSVGLRADGEPDATVCWSEVASKDAVWTVRSPRPGDRVIEHGDPIGLGPILAAKLPRHLRQSWPVFCEGDRIYWIPGVWRDPVRLYSGGLVLEVMRRERPASDL